MAARNTVVQAAEVLRASKREAGLKFPTYLNNAISRSTIPTSNCSRSRRNRNRPAAMPTLTVNSKVSGTADETGLKDADDTKLLFSKPTPSDAAVYTRVKDPSKFDVYVLTGLSKSLEDAILHTPAGDCTRKGMEAVLDHDWKIALAWFQDALNYRPDNGAGLKRLADLAQYTLRREGQDTSSHPLTGKDDRNPNLVRSDTVHFSIGEIAATTTAAQLLAEAAARKYDTEHPGSADAVARAKAVHEAALGEG